MAMKILQDALTAADGPVRQLVWWDRRSGWRPWRYAYDLWHEFLAEGGFVDSPTQATLGEAGEPEYAIPLYKMNSAMERYSRGTR